MSAKRDESRLAAQQRPGGAGPAPGDEAPPDTPGTGEDICPTCNGSGRVDGKTCETCEGTGRITRGIGGA